jgi:DNA polymerase-1
MSITATRLDALRLFHDGWRALSDIEAAGLRIDTNKLAATIVDTKERIEAVQDQLKETDVWKTWVRVYGHKAKLRSRQQLGTVLFDHMGFACPGDARTRSGRYKADAATIGKLDHPFIRRYTRLESLQKTYKTYLLGIQRAVVNEYIHPFFSLHLARSYRSSSDSPNVQNMPVRIPWVAELIRPLFIAPDGFHFAELDYGSIEVRISACNHHDPKLIEYCRNPDSDMHRDMACEIYQCAASQVTDPTRYSAKSNFVFAQFYGDWYKTCARHLWENINTLNLSLADGTPMAAHLAAQGMHTLGVCARDQDAKPGTFEYHIQTVEHDFWHKRFAVYHAWKEEWWQQYLRRGWFDMLTGFRVEGLYARNDVINYCIQGPAFHCLLWSLIQLHRWLRENNMRSRIVGQIHDSLLLYIHKDELHLVIHQANKIMCRMLPHVWRWIIVPLVMKPEVSPLGASWHNKEKYKP